MKTTKNLGLNMPDKDDFVEIDKINENTEKIDEELAKKADAAGGDISETVITTTEESTAEYPVPAAGDSAKTVLGKVQKFFGDIRNWMTGVCLLGQIVNNCVTDNAKLPLSAAQGKALMDLYNALNAKQNTNQTEMANRQGVPQYCADLLIAQGGGRLLYYDANTANTPYKAGVTQLSEGVALTVGDWGYFITSLAIPKGGSHMYIYSKGNGTVSNWKAI